MMRTRIQLFCLLVFSVSSTYGTTNDYAYAEVAENNIYLGQVFHLNVVVKTDQKPDTPDPVQLPDFHATLLDDGVSTGATNTWLYRYALRAKREGNLLIPALRFGSLSTEPIEITAKKPELTDRMKLDLSCSRSSIYLGEPVLLTTTWDSTYPFGAIKAVDFHFPVLNDPRFQVLERYEPDKESRSQTTGLPVQGTRVLATRKSYSVEGVQHQSLTFSKLLIPKKTGTLSIPPATLLCAAAGEKNLSNARNRRSAFQYPAYFDNTFFDQSVTGDAWSRIYTESASPVLDVKPLPDDGRPDFFSGLVGDFRIAVTAEPVEVRVNEPITLTITITAEKYMENIFFGPLRDQPLLAGRFEIPSERSLPRREGQSTIYTQTLRPLSTRTQEIPPLRLAYFSPSSNAYVTVQSEPIPLKVLPADEINVFGNSRYQQRLQTSEEGIRHNYVQPDMLVTRRMPLLGWTDPYAVLVILLIPPLISGGISVWVLLGEKRHHIHRTAKAARAYKVFRKNAAHIIYSHSMKSEIYGDLDQVLRAYLGDRLHLSPGALSSRDAEKRLAEAGADPNTTAELMRLFELCEAYRFTKQYDEAGDAKMIVHHATRVLKAVERTLK
jgi:hypothetical protein